MRGDADIAVRMVQPSQQALVARRIGGVKLGLFAHRRHVDALGAPNSPDDVANHRLIGLDQDQDLMRSGDSSASPPSRLQFRFRSHSTSAQAAAVRVGIGIGALHLIRAAREGAEQARA